MAKELGVSVIAYNPLAGGLLTGKHQQEEVTPGTRFDSNSMYQDRYWRGQNFRAVERLRAAAPDGVGKNADVLVESDRILASVCEAIIGAAYLTFGFGRVAPAIVDAFSDQIDNALQNPVDFKSLLQEQLARRSEIVVYRIEEETGPPHDRSFIAVAEVDGEEIGRGAGKTKKSAEQEAASIALEAFGEEPG